MKNPYQSIGQVGAEWDGNEWLKDEQPTEHIDKVRVFFADGVATITDQVLLHGREGVMGLGELDDEATFELLVVASRIGERLSQLGYRVIY